MKPPIIHQEHFEAWLFSQPDSRSWYFSDNNGCLIATFLKETGMCDNPFVGVVTWCDDVEPCNWHPLPHWPKSDIANCSQNPSQSTNHPDF